jgi:hypothetical protein
VADIGKFLSENIVWLYRTYTKIKKTIKQKRENNNLSMDEDRQMKDQLEQVGIMEPYIPTTMILSILLGYMAIGAILLASWERWGFFEGFYFSFITMTTVSFLKSDLFCDRYITFFMAIFTKNVSYLAKWIKKSPSDLVS